ncbi:MAG TPA: response regulator [Thermoanaerobaculia bacterium]|jgi:CheY-like chemotaxis protein|nr:response regulator [Thermoanaerobaculia bacterium]
MEDKVNILAVDDSAEKLLAVSALLSELNQNVVTATSGREALRHLLRQEFAVVLLDVNMPGMDGFETAALIRQRRSSEHTPIIFITAYGDETHANRGYSLGAVDYILAPVEPEVLRTKVGVFVELFRKTAQVKHQAKSLEQKARQLQRLTEASLAINSALSPDRMLHVVADLARDILGAHQAVALAAAEQKWSESKTAVSLSPRYELEGERPVLRDREAVVSLLSWLRRPIRLAPRDGARTSEWLQFFESGRPAELGWLAAPLTGRDGRNMGLLHLLEKVDGEFTPEDEAVLTQLAQMSSVAIENTLNAEAREANRIKDEFLTTLSHELRTPLTAILGWTRALQSGPPDAKQTTRALEVIERNVLAQTKLIDDLLDVSRIITGKLRLSVRAARLSSIIEAALESMRPAAEAREIEIRFSRDVPADEDELIGDPDRLQQVFWNLISNAIKFTPPRGRVEVRLSRIGSQFEIRVTDTGRGIRPEFLPSVFERFRQADSTTTRAHGGLGIGLAIVRHLVELHGGSVSASSDGEDRGATFSVRLPAVALGVTALERDRATATPVAPSRAGGTFDLRGCRVVLVEDEPDGRELLAESLRKAGADVVAVGSAAEGFQAIRRSPPDVLVSDIAMADEDGYSLVRRVRLLAPENGGRVPAIAVSAYAREEDRLRALAAGFQLHVAKPFDPADLVALVARLARRGVVARPRAAAPAPATAASEASPRGEPALLRVLVIEDDGDSREGLRNLLQVWGHDVDVAEDGARGIEKAVLLRPRVALIDVGLPGMDGYAVASRLRELLGQDEIFLIAVTGFSQAEDLQRAVESGFDAHLSKPINYSRLSSLLAEGNFRKASPPYPIQSSTSG